MRMLNRFLAVAILAQLSACVTSSLPEGYAGPVSIIRDSVHVHSTSKADFFFVDKVDGKKIEDSMQATAKSNYGRGNEMSPVVLYRPVPSRQITITIVGRTRHAMPVTGLLEPVYQVKGNLTINTEQTKIYVVKGELGKDYSAVWVEEEESGTPVGERVEIRGSAALGIFEK